MIDLQNLSKTKEGKEKILQWSAYNLSANFNKDEDTELWSYYNNDFPSSKFDYLRKYGDFVLPANVRHFPIQRPYVNYLSSRETRRPYLFHTKVTDKDGQIKKRQALIEQILEEVETNIEMLGMEDDWQFQQLQQQLQQLQQAASQEPQNQQQAQQIEQIKSILPKFQLQVQMAGHQLGKKKEKYQKIIDHVIKNKKKSLIDFIEEKANKKLKSKFKKLKIKRISNSNFVNDIVTGKQYYYVDYVNGKEVFRSLSPNAVFYSKEASAQLTSECEMAGFVEKMSLSRIINEFDLNDEEIGKIKDNPYGSGGDEHLVAMPGHRAIYMGNGVSPGDDEQGIEVRRVWWVYDKEIKYIKSPNKHNGKFFYKFLSEKDQVINEKDFRYDVKNRKWVSKLNEDVFYDDRSVFRYNENKGQSLNRRYVTVRCKGVIIGGNVTRSYEDEVQLWKKDDMQYNRLPIVGPTFNSKEDIPYSYIKATKGLQEFYNLLGFHEELMMATSGTKTLIFDMLQKPDNLDETEWMYNVKIGFAQLQSYHQRYGKMAFNQFQEVDLSLSASIQYIGNIKLNVEEQMGRIFGISRQAMGQTVRSDQVGTFELSQQSSLLITEILYNKHDIILLEAMNILLQMMVKFDKNVDYLEDDNGVIDLIPEGYFDGRDIEAYLENNSKQENDLSTLKQLSMQYAAKGAYKLGDLIRLYRIEDLNEFQREIDELDRKTMELSSKAQQAEAEQAGEIQSQMRKLDNDYKMAIEKEKNRLKEMELQLKAQESREKLALEAKKAQDNKEKDIADVQLKGMELVNEQSMEAAVLEENKQARTVNNKIQLLQMQMDAILNELNVNLQIDKQEKDYKISEGKNRVEEKKARKMVKEHVSDN